jgi:hypothetical protein
MPRRANVAEHFLDEHMRDPYEVRQHFSTGPNVAENGFFNDYYALVSPNRLPADFVFEVVQVYAIDGQRVAGRNKIRYLPGSVMLYVQGAQGGFRPMGRSRGNEGAPRIERPRLFTPGR